MSLKNALKKLEKIPLSGNEISRSLGNNVNIVMYDSLSDNTTLEDMLGPHKKFALLTMFEGTKIGHWTGGLITPNGTFEHFDSYGKRPDFELSDMGDSSHTYSNIIKRSSIPVKIFNTVDFQEESHSVNTCGRHVIIRLLFSSLNNKQYVMLMRNSCFNADQLVTLMTINDA